ASAPEHEHPRAAHGKEPERVGGIAMTRLRMLTVTLLAAAGTARAVSAAPGDLDTSFNQTGIAALRSPDRFVTPPSSLAVQKAGSILGLFGAGNVSALVRLIPDEDRLDDQFGTLGFARLDLGSADMSAEAVAVEKDGRIVVAGTIIVGGVFQFA